MRALLVSLASLAFLLLAGCNQQAAFDRLVPQAEAALAQGIVAQLAARDYAPVEAQLDAPLRTAQTRAQLEEIARLIPGEAARSVRTVGVRTLTTDAFTRYDLTLEYEYPSTWRTANVVLERRREGALVIAGIHVTPRTQSLESENAFTLAGKTAAHYAVLAGAAAFPLFICYALAACARTQGLRRKWLWLLFIAVGLARFQLDWSSGAWVLQPLGFVLLGAGAAKSGPFAPWIVQLGLPLGAALFLVRRHLQRTPHAAQPAAPGPQ